MTTDRPISRCVQARSNSDFEKIHVHPGRRQYRDQEESRGTGRWRRNRIRLPQYETTKANSSNILLLPIVPIARNLSRCLTLQFACSF